MKSDHAASSTGRARLRPEKDALRSPDPHGAVPRCRVLLLIKCLGYGGAENLLVQMVRHRDAVAFDYEVAFVLESENTLVPELEDAGVPVHCLGATGNTDLTWMRRLRHLLEDRDFDIVHTHLPYAATLGRLVVATMPRRRSPAVVYTEHSMWDKMAIAIKALNRVTIGLDDRLLVVSEAARRSMPRALRRRAAVIVHGIDLEPVRAVLAQRDGLRDEVRAELGLRGDDLLVLTVANLRREKGYDILLQASAYLGRSRGPCHAGRSGTRPVSGRADRSTCEPRTRRTVPFPGTALRRAAPACRQ